MTNSAELPSRDELVEKVGPPLHQEISRTYQVSKNEGEAFKTGAEMLKAVLQERGSDGKLYDQKQFTKLHEGNFQRGIDILQPETDSSGRYPPQMFYIPVYKRGFLGRKEETDEAMVGIKLNNDVNNPDKNTVLMYQVKHKNGVISANSAKKFLVSTEDAVTKGMQEGKGRGKWFRGELTVEQYNNKYAKKDSKYWASERRIRKLEIDPVEEAGRREEVLKRLEGYYVEQLAEYDKKTAAEIKKSAAEAEQAKLTGIENQRKLIVGLTDLLKTGVIQRVAAERMIKELGLEGVVDVDKLIAQAETQAQSQDGAVKVEIDTRRDELEAENKELKSKLQKEITEGRKREQDLERQHKEQQENYEKQAKEWQDQLQKTQDLMKAIESRLAEQEKRAKEREAEIAKAMKDKDEELAAQKGAAIKFATLALDLKNQLNELEKKSAQNGGVGGNVNPPEGKVIEGQFRDITEATPVEVPPPLSQLA